MNSELTVHHDGTISIVTINRPDARNAINLEVANAMYEALRELDESDDLRVGIIVGADGNFSSGMDLKAFARGNLPHVREAGFAGIVERLPRKPLIAAVEGYALAGGFEIALACDLIVAADGARFGLPEVKRGLVAAAGGLTRLPDRIPVNVAMELALTGRLMNAGEAAGFGLINRLVPNGTALEQAIDLARTIAANAPLSTIASKRIIRASRTWSDNEIFDRQRPLLAHIEGSRDAQEGARAFAEKRAPRWQGR